MCVQDHMMGVNCELCEDGYYRPSDVDPRRPDSCLPCLCDGPGAVGVCIKDDSRLMDGIVRHNTQTFAFFHK